MSHIDRDAPSVQLIESALFYHTDQDRPDYVPEPGMRSRRPRLRQDHRRGEQAWSRSADAEPCRTSAPHRPHAGSVGAVPVHDSRSGGRDAAPRLRHEERMATPITIRPPPDPKGRQCGEPDDRRNGGAARRPSRAERLVGRAEPRSRLRSSAPRTTRTRSAAGRCCTCRASVTKGRVYPVNPNRPMAQGRTTLSRRRVAARGAGSGHHRDAGRAGAIGDRRLRAPRRAGPPS